MASAAKIVKEIVKKINQEHAYVPDEPIHFKMGENKKSKPLVKEAVEDNEHRDWEKHNDNSHLGDTSGEISQKLATYRKPYRNEIEKEHVARYTDDSEPINRDLLDRHFKKTKILDHHKNQIKALDRRTSSPIGHHVSLYSGLGFNPGQHITGKNLIRMPAYTSLTHSKPTATFFSELKHTGEQNDEGKPVHHILHVHMRPEDHADHIGDAQYNASEHETILPRDTVLKIHGTPTTHTGRNGAIYKIWHAHVHKQPKATV